ncbi:MAG: hypothetical protein VZR95_04170 [Alphaproteobacteria bacterium]
MGIFFSIWRRFFGGYDSKIDFLEQRGIQMIFCIVAVFLWEFYAKSKVWYIALIIAVLVYIFWCCGHWYYFKCGTESNKYIDDEMAKGRKPAMNWIVAPVNKWLGFAERSRQYCFVGLLIRYFLWSLPVAAFVGWSFAACAFCIPFIYNACFWVQFPKIKMAESPTNWAELLAGLVIGWGLM